MTEPLYIAHVELSKVAGTHRRATIATGVTVEMGVHGAIREHYRLTEEKNLPLPVDYIVAATGG